MASTSGNWSREQKKAIAAASVGTLFAWYDFYLYGALADVIAKRFFAGLDERTAFIFALLAFAAGFVVRPFGGLVFGRLGDLIGRKHPFLITVLLMGLSTFMVGLLPDYGSVGVAAPLVLMLLRLMQGFALGGEYGGAAVCLAEYAPPTQRGVFTAWVQATATLGLFLSLVVTQAVRYAVGDVAFADWGWRLPFLLSAVLLALSVYVRLRLRETPVFLDMRSRSAPARKPVREVFGQSFNRRRVGLALLGLTAGQGVVWYGGQIYALFFLTQSLKVDSTMAQWMVAAALLLGAPFFWVWGALSDRVGRKPVIMAGFLLAAFTSFPAFQGVARAANPVLAQAQRDNQVVLRADLSECVYQFNVLGVARNASACDLARQVLANASVSYAMQAAGDGALASVLVGGREVQSYALRDVAPDVQRQRTQAFREALASVLARAGYPEQANRHDIAVVQVVAWLTYLVAVVAMVYGPIAAMLSEMFPTRIRYTALSLPYHLGNGWFGGLLPAVSFAIVAHTGDMFDGLWYPVVIASVAFLVGVFFLPETRGADLTHPRCGSE